DTVLATLKQDWARNMSPWLRQAYHHEAAALARVDEYVEIARPKLAVLLGGTPGQVFELFPHAGDGLFSRFLFQTLPLEGPWVSGRPSARVNATRAAVKGLARVVEGAHRDL